MAAEPVNDENCRPVACTLEDAEVVEVALRLEEEDDRRRAERVLVEQQDAEFARELIERNRKLCDDEAKDSDLARRLGEEEALIHQRWQRQSAAEAKRSSKQAKRFQSEEFARIKKARVQRTKAWKQARCTAGISDEHGLRVRLSPVAGLDRVEVSTDRKGTTVLVTLVAGPDLPEWLELDGPAGRTVPRTHTARVAIRLNSARRQLWDIQGASAEVVGKDCACVVLPRAGPTHDRTKEMQTELYVTFK